MYFWEKSEYTIGNIRVFTTPNEPKYNNVLRDTRSLQEKLEDFEREFWKDEPIVINTKR